MLALDRLGNVNANKLSQILIGYRSRTPNQFWHQLEDDGYIHSHLTWHMEKALWREEIYQLLQEETEAGKNGWYEACDRLRKTAIFVTDVARAWDWAEQIYENFPSTAIGLQCRYALITSSLNTIAGNIPPKLIAILVEKQFWTPAQGLAYVRQIKSLDQRAEALRELAKQLPEVLPEALEIARSIGDEYHRARALRELAPQLPEALLPEVLEAARSIGDEYHRAVAMKALLPPLAKIVPTRSSGRVC